MPRTCPDCDWVWPKPTGPCPNCGSAGAPERGRVEVGLGEGSAGRVHTRIPWSLIILGVAFAIYLTWRLVQVVRWVIG